MRVASQDQDWESTVTWSKAKSLEEFRKCPEDAEASYYKLTGVVRGRLQLFYLGKTFDQYTHWRLEQPDHQERIATIRRAYPEVYILVSVGDSGILRQVNGSGTSDDSSMKLSRS